MADLHEVGGTPAVIKYLLDAGLLNGDCMTVTGKTIAENVADLPGLAEGQPIIQPIDKPIKATGHLQVLRGNVAPEGSVAKITGKEGLKFSGPARVFDSEEDMLKGLEDKKIKKGDVVVIRYEGPKGGPGMPEMLTPTSAIIGAGLGWMWRCSPMADSPAVRTASSWGTSLPKPRKAARSRFWKMATWSPSTPTANALMWPSPMKSSPTAPPAGRSPRIKPTGELCTNTSKP
jgi:hypothetical protein